MLTNLTELQTIYICHVFVVINWEQVTSKHTGPEALGPITDLIYKTNVDYLFKMGGNAYKVKILFTDGHL